MGAFGSARVGQGVINVKDYGALGTGKIAFLANMTSGSHTLTLAGPMVVQSGTSQDTFVAGDVGKTIVVTFAGTSGADLVTTITGYTSPTQVTLSAAAANTTYFPCQCHWYTTGQNDQPALQAAANAASASQTTLYIPAGVYIVASTNSAIGMIQTSQSIAPYLGAIVGDGPTRTWLCASNPSQIAHMMLLTDVPPGFVLSGFATRGPSPFASAGGGIIFALTSDTNVNGVTIEEVDAWQSAEEGFKVNTPILSTFINCNATFTNLDGYNVYSGTSVHFDTCYATSNTLAGFHLNGTTLGVGGGGQEYSVLTACASESSGISYYFDNCGAVVANGCGSEQTSDNSGTAGALYKGHAFVISGGQGGVILNGSYSTELDYNTGPPINTASRHVLVTGSCPGTTIVGFDVDNPGGGNNPTFDFQVDSGCTNVAFVNPTNTTFALLSDAGTNTLYSQGNKQNRYAGIGTVVTTAAFALSGGWGTSASKAITNANSKDTGGTITITSSTSSGTISANPTVTFTFVNGTWTNIPIVVASRGDTTAPTTGFWSVTTTATTAVFTFVGTPGTAATYVLNWHTMGT